MSDLSCLEAPIQDIFKKINYRPSETNIIDINS